jgi:hypothetical protein
MARKISVDVETARRIALALPGTTESPHFDLSSFRVQNKIFATVPPGDECIRIFVGDDDVKALVAEDPNAFAELWWGKKLSGVNVTLAKVNVADLEDVIETAWRRKAPKTAIAELEATRK